MLTRCMARTVSIVGAGRVGQTLGKRLNALGWRIGAVVTRSNATARAAVRAVGAGRPSSVITQEVAVSDLILIATPDRAFAAVVREIVIAGGNKLKGKIVLHTSGALDSKVLAP